MFSRVLFALGGEPEDLSRSNLKIPSGELALPWPMSHLSLVTVGALLM